MKRIACRSLGPLLLLSAVISCVNLTGDGGGSDVGNGVVIGRLLNGDGDPSGHTRVKLLPYYYNPASDLCATGCATDTTDGNGSFEFSIAANGTYNIEAVNLDNGLKTLIPEISVRLNDTLYLPQKTLTEPGMITIFLPDSIDTATGYLYIQGTTLWLPLSSAQHLNEGGFIITFNEVPATTIPAIQYVHQTMTVQSVAISDTISVLSNSVSVINAFTYWKTYTTDNSPILSNSVRDIELLPNGMQWIATSSGGAAEIGGTEWTTVTKDNSPLPSNDVRDIAFENNMTIWFATTKGAASLGADQWAILTKENSGLPSNQLTDILIDHSGCKWFGTQDAGIARYDGYSWTIFNTGNTPLPSNIINQLLAENNSGIPGGWALWVATPKGAAVFNNDVWTVFTTHNSGIMADAVKRIAVDHNGNKWFGHESGVSLLSGMQWTGYTAAAVAALSAPVTAISEDRKGTMWFGTLLGLVKFDGLTWTPCDGERYALIDDVGIYSLFIDAQDNKWVGTANNGLIVFGPNFRANDPKKGRI
jgi:hypothetical protein